METRNGVRVRANLVVTADGATSIAGRSSGLSSAEDRKRFHQIRKSADLIIIGGNTAANEPYGSTPCDLWVLSSRHLPQSVASNSRAKAMNFSIEYAVKVATKKGYREILIEAGPSLLAEALHLKLVDELFLTIVQLPAPSGENNIDINLFTQGYVETQRSESQNSAVQESYLTFQPAQLSQAK